MKLNRTTSNFYPRSPCGERRVEEVSGDTWARDFYPRSPCGERLTLICPVIAAMTISIHALLAESDERADSFPDAPPEISIHALLAESDTDAINGCNPDFISIHALLAESDATPGHPNKSVTNFYPRSPCGERHKSIINSIMQRNDFYPRSPCGERQKNKNIACNVINISIHALLAESDFFDAMQIVIVIVFLSTLSLRRATNANLPSHRSNDNFYPRSPCGERRFGLARLVACVNFYPRSPCGERRPEYFLAWQCMSISIHALLAESDSKSAQNSGALLRI